MHDKFYSFLIIIVLKQSPTGIIVGNCTIFPKKTTPEACQYHNRGWKHHKCTVNIPLYLHNQWDSHTYTHNRCAEKADPAYHSSQISSRIPSRMDVHYAVSAFQELFCNILRTDHHQRKPKSKQVFTHDIYGDSERF